MPAYAPSEIALGLHLLRFYEVIDIIAEDLFPNRFYELAEKFNAFFRDYRVEGTSEENSRLILTNTVEKVFKAGFSLLGVRTLERM